MTCWLLPQFWEIFLKWGEAGVGDMETERETGEWGYVRSDPNNVTLQNRWWIQINSLYSMRRQINNSQTAAICFQRDCRAYRMVGGAGWWLVNGADTPSYCIELIHLIKGVFLSLASRSGAEDLYLKYSLAWKHSLQLPCKWAKAMKRRRARLAFILW